MAIRNFAKYLWAAAMAVACQVQEPQNAQAPQNTEPAVSEDEGVVPGLVSVQFDDALLAVVEAELLEGKSVPTKAPGMSAIAEELGIEYIERVFPDAGEYEARSRKAGMHRFYSVVFSADTPATKASESLKALPGVISAHPVRQYHKRAFSTPDDPYFSRQWHYVNSKTAGVDINVKGVWEQYTTGSDKVVVSVVDEPVDPTHEDLKDNLWTDDAGHTGYNFARNSWDLSIRTDGGYGDFGHGTHVGGTIGAVSNNATGLAGIAGGDAAAGVKGVRLMSCAVFSGTRYASSFPRAVKWGADNGAVISQNSWGPSADLNNDGKISTSELNTYRAYRIETYDPELKAAIDYFIEYAGCDAEGNQRADSPMKGGLVFFAAGNEGDYNVDWDPYAGYEPVIGVGAMNEYGNRASYSNYGDWVDLAVPVGEGTTSSNSVWSTLPLRVASGYGYTENTDGYGGTSWIGTSMACPHASGVAALIISYFGGEGFTADAAKDILLGGLGATVGGSKPVGGKLDALASFRYGIEKYGEPGDDGPDDPGGDPPAGNKAPVITLSQASMELRYNEGGREITVTASDPDGDDVTLSCEPGSKALSFDPATGIATVDAFNEAPGRYVANFTAKDVYGTKASASFEYVILDNRAPFIDLEPSSLLLKAHESAVVSVNGTDPDGDPVEIALVSPGSDAVTYDPSTKTLRISAVKASAGAYKAVLSIKDVPSYSTVQEKSATADLPYTILQNHAPAILKYIPDSAFYGLDVITIDNSVHFTDIDGEILHYYASVSDPDIAAAAVNGNNTLIIPKAYGVTSVTVTAEDGLAARTSITFKIATANPNQPVTVPSSQVTDVLTLNIGSTESVSVNVQVYNASGARVLGSVFTASVFYPAQMDVSSLAPGRYSAIVKYGGNSATVKFVKY